MPVKVHYDRLASEPEHTHDQIRVPTNDQARSGRKNLASSTRVTGHFTTSAKSIRCSRNMSHVTKIAPPYIYIYIYIYLLNIIYIFCQHIFVNPFELLYRSYDIQQKLFDKPSIIFLKYFLPNLGPSLGEDIYIYISQSDIYIIYIYIYIYIYSIYIIMQNTIFKSNCLDSVGWNKTWIHNFLISFVFLV